MLKLLRRGNKIIHVRLSGAQSLQLKRKARPVVPPVVTTRCSRCERSFRTRTFSLCEGCRRRPTALLRKPGEKPEPQEASVIRHCLRCELPFKSRGFRLCSLCHYKNQSVEITVLHQVHNPSRTGEE